MNFGQEVEIDPQQAVELVKELLRRYRGSTFEMLHQALIPMRIPIKDIKNTQFWAEYPTDTAHIVPGKTGKLIPKGFINGSKSWKELVKGRITELEDEDISGELYMMRKSALKKGLEEIRAGDLFEIDCFGVTSKLESALTEAAFAKVAEEEGYYVKRMPENIAIHVKPKLAEYLENSGLPHFVLEILRKDERAKGWPNFDFLIEKHGIIRRVEVKSLWGTDTSKARLIHSVGGRWVTSSCRFEDQDIFAVNLWLRTGNIKDLAFARSVLKDDAHPFGLPAATRRSKDGRKLLLPDYVNQNPDCQVGNGSWFSSLDEVWQLF